MFVREELVFHQNSIVKLSQQGQWSVKLWMSQSKINSLCPIMSDPKGMPPGAYTDVLEAGLTTASLRNCI